MKSSLVRIFYKVVYHHIIYMCDFFCEFRWFFCCGLYGFSRRLWFPLDTFSYMIPWILDGWSATIVILCACGLFLYALRNTNSAWTWSECVATARTSSPASEWTLVKKKSCVTCLLEIFCIGYIFGDWLLIRCNPKTHVLITNLGETRAP